MSSYAIQHSLTLVTLDCCNCGVTFAFPQTLRDRLKANGEFFYCPLGHSQHFTRTEAQRLRELLEQANRRNTELVDEVARAQRETKRIEKRIHAGVCPCCNRTFQNLARHMATKHKEVRS